jgi:hypothetical protein
MKTLDFTDYIEFFEQQISNYSFNFDFVELQVSDKKELQNKDKINFWYLFFVVVLCSSNCIDFTSHFPPLKCANLKQLSQ